MKMAKSLITGEESGVSFVETAVALALLGILAVAFLSGLATESRAVNVADEKATAESLARSQIEWVKNVTYAYDATTYSPAAIPGNSDYEEYSVEISAQSLSQPDTGVQKITVTVRRGSKDVFILESYKADR